MKQILGLLALFIITNSRGQTTPSEQVDTSMAGIILFEDFNDNKNNWTIGDNKQTSSSISDGIYYLRSLGHAYGEATEVKIDSRKDFEIQTRIKILSGHADHRGYYSMLFWGREAMDGYYFTFSKDGFASVQICSGKNQRDCLVKKGSLQKTALNPDDFNVYTIRKTGKTYSFFVNGSRFYTMPFSPFFGNLIGVGAGRKVGLAIDYLKVIYL